MKTISITSLKGQEYETALKTVNNQLKNIGIELDVTNNLDRQKIVILAINLRIKFNEVGGLA